MSAKYTSKTGKRVDKRKGGKTLERGETYDERNKRYIFQRMVGRNRISCTAKTLEELRIKKNELLCQIDRGMNIATQKGNSSLDDFFDYWAEFYAINAMKATTLQNYRAYYNAHIRNTNIGEKAIKDFRKEDFQYIINEMRKDGKSHSTMSILKSCLYQVFQAAIDENAILKNPIVNVKLPKTKSKTRNAINMGKLSDFLKFIKNSSYSYLYPEIITLFNCGLRIGEMCAITWNDINFENNTISINKSLNRYRKKDFGFTMAIASPKTESSNRIIRMNNLVRTELLKLKLARNNLTSPKMIFVNDAGQKTGEISGFVFLNTKGHVWNEPTFRSLLKRAAELFNEECKKKGVEPFEYFCPHQARHTFTTAAYDAGVDVKITAALLGHKSANTTLNVYTHISEKKIKEQESAIQAIKIS